MIKRERGRGAVSLYLPLILVILIFGLVPLQGAADEGFITLTGLVIDFETRQPIDNATVTVWE
ncbi:MAG: hypothetical protein ACETVR_03080, partial [Candidatus Bathyarchaeia archaeon]